MVSHKFIVERCAQCDSTNREMQEEEDNNSNKHDNHVLYSSLCENALRPVSPHQFAIDIPKVFVYCIWEFGSPEIRRANKLLAA